LVPLFEREGLTLFCTDARGVLYRIDPEEGEPEEDLGRFDEHLIQEVEELVTRK